MENKKLEDNVAPTAEMQLGELDQVKQLVVDADLGGRSTVGLHGKVMLGVGLAWVIFQLWYASPLPFVMRFGVFNDTEARSIHLATGLFLAFLAFPASKRSPRNYVPVLDWIFAVAGAFAAGYLYLFYNELATRPGAPTQFDVVVGVVGILLLLEATRRAVGLPMAVLAVIFLFYVLAGAYLPDVIAHKGASIPRMISHMWLVTEGVFGIALGVSVAFIFVFVLFGTLLDRAGGGNYMMQVSFALLGHMRGGPAKVAVVSSALNGLISGSSVSNVVSGGIFTIPLMKKAGYGGVKAAAIETASSVNGQIMPPVMGAAAFLMVEYVGIPYSEIIRHAFIPAVISYIALFYIVHLEAMRLGMEPMAKVRERTASAALLSWALGLAGTIAAFGAIYYVAIGTQMAFGAAAPWILGALLIALYIYSTWVAAREPDLPVDIDIDNPVLPPAWPTVKAGMHFLIPIGVLLWCLMVEELSPGLSAFYAIVAQVILMTTQRPMIEFFRGKKSFGIEFTRGVGEVVNGCNDGARNMIGIAVATGCAGLIVGAITLTGLGLAHDRLRRARFGRQRDGDAAVHRVCLPGARHGRTDDSQLHPGRDADGASDRRTRRAIGSGDSADRGASVRLLLRDHGRHHSACGSCQLRRGRDRKGRSDPGRHTGFGLCAAHRAVAIYLDLQPGVASDRHSWLVGSRACRIGGDDRVVDVRCRYSGLVPYQVSLVGSGATADRHVHIVPARLVRRPHRTRVHRRARRPLLRDRQQPRRR